MMTPDRDWQHLEAAFARADQGIQETSGTSSGQHGHPTEKTHSPGRSMPGTLSVRTLKVTAVVPVEEVLAILWPQGTSHVPITVSARGRKLRARLNAKSLKKVQAAIRAAGTDRVAVVLQATLDVGDVLAEAGLTVQPKGPKPMAAAPSVRPSDERTSDEAG